MAKSGDRNFKPADFHLCPICRGPVRESWCANCKAHTIVHWGPLYIPSDKGK
jgi:hypothetical protein